MSQDFKRLPEINRADVPPRNKWVAFFDTLPLEKAAPFECETRKSAKLLGATISGCCRYGRRSYKIHWRIIPQDGKCILYVWKDK